jgi:hypothetical protein
MLARRVTDSHERKAAVELQALRDGLAKLGFVRKEQLKEKALAPVVEDFRQVAVRQHRQFRPMRATRLSPVQRLANLVENVRRWLGEALAYGQPEALTEKVGQAETAKPTESVKPDEKIAETVKPALTVREALQQQRRHRANRQQPQRRSHGISP